MMETLQEAKKNENIDDAMEELGAEIVPGTEEPKSAVFADKHIGRDSQHRIVHHQRFARQRTGASYNFV